MLIDDSATRSSYGKILLVLGLLPVLLLSACSRSPENQDNEARLRIERAEAYHKQGQYRAAMIEARNAIKISPQLAESHIALARIFNTLAQSKQALKQLDQIPQPQRIGSLYQATLSQAYLVEGKYRSALKVLEHSEALRLEKPKEYALLQAQALAAVGEAEAAATSFRQVLDLDPKHKGPAGAGQNPLPGRYFCRDAAGAGNPRTTVSALTGCADVQGQPGL